VWETCKKPVEGLWKTSRIPDIKAYKNKTNNLILSPPFPLLISEILTLAPSDNFPNLTQ
jgi:hypothetical protein